MSKGKDLRRGQVEEEEESGKRWRKTGRLAEIKKSWRAGGEAQW